MQPCSVIYGMLLRKHLLLVRWKPVRNRVAERSPAKLRMGSNSLASPSLQCVQTRSHQRHLGCDRRRMAGGLYHGILKVSRTWKIGRRQVFVISMQVLGVQNSRSSTVQWCHTQPALSFARAFSLSHSSFLGPTRSLMMIAFGTLSSFLTPQSLSSLFLFLLFTSSFCSFSRSLCHSLLCNGSTPLYAYRQALMVF